ncbi:MAG: hypothetical protein KQ78_01773 [Candidatus Izimaplasma bacterium HR2]|nr:MAG: hypothetical protein KQ78_01773 [Candidatus Izimaplasma bacterium HR2]
MKAICTKVCETGIFIHEYISVGTVLEIENDLVLRTDPFGYIEVICETGSVFFKEHFNLVKGG